ncbi:hypothetical protein H7777_004685 [Escherichia coli]|nr:hypothetical protein [Escherichia coli]
MNIRKLKKLKKNPKLFFNDMMKKRKSKVTNIKKLNGSYNIVVFSSDDEHKTSNYNFIKNIRDDENINVIHVNLFNKNDFIFLSSLLKYENTLFLWHDDYIDSDFLQKADEILNSKNKGYADTIIIPNSKLSEIPFIKSTSDAISSHYELKEYNRIVNEYFVANSIYGMIIPSILIKKHLVYHENAHKKFIFNGFIFLLEILEECENKYTIRFEKKLHYLNNRMSSITFKGQSWCDRSIFCDDFISLVKGIELILEHSTSDNIKISVKRSFFNLLLTYIKSGLTNHSLLDIMSNDEKNKFKHYLNYALNLIGDDCISSFNISCAETIKIGCLKKLGIEKQSKYCDLLQLDKDKNEVLLRYYSSCEVSAEIRIDNKEVIPIEFKTICHNLFSDVFFYEQRMWLWLTKQPHKKPIKIKISNRHKEIRDFRRKVEANITFDKIQSQYNAMHPKFKYARKYSGCWLLMDRDNQADDNAEHLYRYINQNRPDISIFFVLLKDSHDWVRLEKEGFKLLAFGSREHEAALESCDKIISSHAAQFVTDYFKDKRMLWKKFIFLQHGIIHNDQSTLFRPDWKKIDIFLTSGVDEYNSLAGEKTTYKFTKKEVKLTGLPRHDSLLKKDIDEENIILVMPTWRPNLLGKVTSGTSRELLPDFQNSEYAKAWTELLSSASLYNLIKNEGYRIIFFPHANMQPYISEFNLPEHISIQSHYDGSIQSLFKRSKIMITDYSSVAFEMAYLNKPVCYYQFDEKQFFTKGHYNKGYFDYRSSGFGPVFNTVEGVLEFLHNIIKGRYPNSDIYEKRAANFFPYRDGKCCERVLDTIIKLKQPRVTQCSTDYLKWAAHAYKTGDYISARSRYEKYFINHNDSWATYNGKHLFNYMVSLISLGDFNIALNLLNTGRISVYKKKYLKYRINVLLSLISLTPLNIKETINNKTIKDITWYCSDSMDSCFSTRNKLFLHESSRRLRLLEKNKAYEDVVVMYKSLSDNEKHDIINKSIYIRTLYHLKKWKLLLDNINSNDIFTGQTGINIYMAAYFFAIRSSKSKVPDLNKYVKYLLSDTLDNQYVDEIFMYLLYHNENEIIDLYYQTHSSEINTKSVLLYFKHLIKVKKYEQAYALSKKINITEIDDESLFFIAEFYIIYEDYDLAMLYIKHIRLRLLLNKSSDVYKRIDYLMSLIP